MSKQSDKSDKNKEKDKHAEKSQTTQANQNQTPQAFLKTTEVKKKDTQAQMVENQPLGPEVIKTPITIPIVIPIVNTDLEQEKELEKTKETEGKKKIEENETEKKEMEGLLFLIRMTLIWLSFLSCLRFPYNFIYFV